MGIGWLDLDDQFAITRDYSGTGWDSEMIEYAYVVKHGDEYVMFYNGNGFGASGTGVAIGRLA